MRIARPKHRIIRGGTWHKGQPGWKRVTWVGKSELTGEHLGLSADGLLYSRAVRRLTPENRADQALMNAVVGFPWNTTTRRKLARAKAEPAPLPVGTLPPLAGAAETSAAAAAPTSAASIPVASAAPAAGPAAPDPARDDRARRLGELNRARPR